MCATWLTHVIPIHLITLKMFGEVKVLIVQFFREFDEKTRNCFTLGQMDNEITKRPIPN
jgi:nucleosome binding factor SPN SPT16 subunit